jgi:sugar lactone lactonase YvrE
MMSREQMIKDPHAGDLIALDVGVKGVPETKFPA